MWFFFQISALTILTTAIIFFAYALSLFQPKNLSLPTEKNKIKFADGIKRIETQKGTQ